MSLEFCLHEGNCIICKKLYNGKSLIEYSNHDYDYFNICSECIESELKIEKTLFNNYNYKTKYKIKCNTCLHEDIKLIYGFKKIGNIDLLHFICNCCKKN